MPTRGLIKDSRATLKPSEAATTDYRDASAAAEKDLADVGLGDDPVPKATTVAKRMGIPVQLLAPHELCGLRARLHVPTRNLLGQVGGVRIFVRADLSPPDAQFAVAHELGHVNCRRALRHISPNSWQRQERWANLYAAALSIPATRMRRAFEHRGLDIKAIVRDFAHVPPTCAVLRGAEIDLFDVCITQDDAVRHMRARQRLSAELLRMAARAAALGTRQPRPEIRSARLDDAPHRFAVVIAA